MGAKRIRTKIGDVFSVKVSESGIKYFQLIAFDLTQLNSDVIRAFKKVYTLDEHPTLSEIVNGEVEFYAHCVTNFGLKLSLWEKVGSIADIGDTSHILFRCAEDDTTTPGIEPIKVSTQWYVWHINDKTFTSVGKLKGENKKAEIGLVVSPWDIVERIKTGKYNFWYPGFE